LGELTETTAPRVIGIGGCSNAGKSRLAKQLAAAQADADPVILCQDHYVLPENQLPLIRDHIDWERPETMNWTRLHRDLQRAILSGSKLVILEGLFAFQNAKINALYTDAFFVHVPREVFVERKKRDLRWGEEPPWYIDHVWRSFQRWGALEMSAPMPIPIREVDGSSNGTIFDVEL
jgi:uridine kinase